MKKGGTNLGIYARIKASRAEEQREVDRFVRLPKQDDMEDNHGLQECRS